MEDFQGKTALVTGATAYSCSKAGITAFAKMTALELARNKIRVNVICPDAIESEIQENTEQRSLEKVKQPVEYPEGAISLTGGAKGKPEHVAELVCFLASDAASLITGTEVWIDGASRSCKDDRLGRSNGYEG